ncbi:MAG: septum formation protein Maf [Erysipelotrichaceae bacterium]|nr:septum formation protein Maf [Erysipelotrichaceae bacterium]
MMLILASKSPRRKEILSMLDVPFECIEADINETIDQTKDLNSEMERVSFAKAYEVFKNHPEDVVVGADTIVVLDGQILLKPKSEQDAFEMLKKLQDYTHLVKTGVSIISKGRSESFVNTSIVRFNPMSDEEIWQYIKSGEPMDKAGSYGIQGLGAKYIDFIEGDFYSIMGLPISQLYTKLKEYLPL